jgi:hypothetical protein
MGAPLCDSQPWLRKTRKLRRHLRQWPSTAGELAGVFGRSTHDSLAWLELTGLASYSKEKRWSLTPLGIESMDWLAIPRAFEQTPDKLPISDLVESLAEKYATHPADILSQATVGRGVPARDELMWALRGRGLSVSQIAMRMGFTTERVANSIGRHSMRVLRSYA